MIKAAYCDDDVHVPPIDSETLYNSVPEDLAETHSSSCTPDPAQPSLEHDPTQLSVITTDWSRTHRKRLALLKAGSDPKQMKITSFYDYLLEAIRNVPEIEEVLEMNERDSSVSCMLERLLNNAKRNAAKSRQGIRHEEVVKKFATSLLVYCGPLAYNFLQCNLSKALPCLRSVQRIFTKKYNVFVEGDFRFDDLLEHLTSYNSTTIVTIGEDATRVIGRVEYDSESNKLVGFVLPLNDEGLPVCNSYLATSFALIEEAFKSGNVAKYAFVYMVKPLALDIPAFCLGCFGTDNKFCTDAVLKRWKHIVHECGKRGITVVSFGADGDSRELKAMQVSTQICLSKKKLQQDTWQIDKCTEKLKIPPSWSDWFAVNNPTNISYVQDIVHLAVKLKARLLKPSIILPMGKYLAGSYDLRFVQQTFGKDEHGVREKDVNHKDRQNFDAVLHITTESVISLVSKCPSAKGTATYLQIIKNVVDAFLDKGLEPLSRVKKIWFVVFFVRYWRWWLLQNPNYTLGSNFITTNAYVCIELNAHALITLILTLRESNHEEFLPWLLGSQSCEKIFRSARSMSSTFSTIINFGMLGLIRRLHRLHTQLCLQSEASKTGIKYPNTHAHRHKEGHNVPQQPKLPTNEEITMAVEKAKIEAQTLVETLGMAELLKKSKCWNFPPIPTVKHEEIKDDHDDIDDQEVGSDEGIECLIEEANIGNDPSDIKSSIDKLTEVGIIDTSLNTNLTSLCKSAFKRISSTGLPIYEQTEDSSKTPRKSRKKFSPFVEVTHNNKSAYIHKTTAVWLLQEGERISSDRLFRVRAKQPFAIEQQNQERHLNTNPFVCLTINVGDYCMFKVSDETYKLGKVLQFSYYKEKTKKAKQFLSSSVHLSSGKENVGVLCTWYTSTSPSSPSKNSCAVFSMVSCSDLVHRYIPVSSYLCTLPTSCLTVFEKNDSEPVTHSILSNHQSAATLATAEHITLTNASLTSISQFLADSNVSTTHTESENTATPKTDCQLLNKGHNHWLTVGSYVLTKKDRQDVVCGRELSSQHVSSFLHLLKSKFSQFAGMQDTLLQQRQNPAIQHESGQTILQVIHIRRNHWAAIQAINDDEVMLFDSSFDSFNDDTFDTIAKLVYTSKDTLTVKLMNVNKQAGATDCSLFALAMVTSLAFGEDPIQKIYDQRSLRTHYLNVLESGKVQQFPVLQRRRVKSRIKSAETFEINCHCRVRDYGEMVGCDKCDSWYHSGCVTYDKEKSYICNKCS